MDGILTKDGSANVMLTGEMLSAVPTTPAGTRALWVLERLAAICAGESPPNDAELEQEYTSSWLAEVPMSRVLDDVAPLMATVTAVHEEAARPNAITIVLDRSDGLGLRFRLTVEDGAPHRIKFQLLGPALDSSSYVDRTVQRDGRSVHIRDFGGRGPLLLLWHGAGCDATIWEAVVPSLRGFRVVAQDLPGHGGSPLGRLSVADTLADARAVLADLGEAAPTLIGHSTGGWIALHFAAVSSCDAVVCLDGPASLDWTAMGLDREHPGWLPDPPDVRRDLAALDCPALMTLSRGSSVAEQEWMVPFRADLCRYLADRHPKVRVEWQSTGHMNVLSMPRQTADLISAFLGELNA